MDVVQRIMDEISGREGASHLDFSPLYETLDPQALEELIESGEDDTLTVEFVYEGYTVRVYGDGTVEIRSIDASPE